MYENLPPLGVRDNLPPQECAFPYRLAPGESVLLDWGRKRTGYLSVAGSGSVEYSYCSDLRILDLFDSDGGQEPDFWGDKWPSFCVGRARDTIDLTAQPRLVNDNMVPLRYLRLWNRGSAPAQLDSVVLRPSEFPAQPIGSFECGDEVLNLAWRMGVDTVHLCTQLGEESQMPVYAPFGDGYVQWDGCRRDREVWGGDLRPASLAWYYNFADQSPIKNSLYIIMMAQHVACSEHGLFPGSGSSHQIFYEWAFWEVVCLWEYIMHTGDQAMLQFAKHNVPMFLDWCERKFSENPDGWIHGNVSWMYTIAMKDEPLPALQAAAAAGFQAMVRMFTYIERPDLVDRASKLLRHISDRFDEAFWVGDLQAYRFMTPKGGDAPHSDLCTNCWAISTGLAPESKWQAILDSLKKHHWTESGSVNLFPILGSTSPHDNTIWPYANSYEVVSRMGIGDVEGGLEVLRRYTNLIRRFGHHTMFEMIHLDGSLPILAKGDTLSFCHAWSAQASWALQRYLLGVAPATPGWGRFTFQPMQSSLEWVRGAVATPHGTIDVELESKNGSLAGKVSHPREISPADGHTREGVEFAAK